MVAPLKAFAVGGPAKKVATKWYSALEKALENADPGASWTFEKWNQWLHGRPGVKQEELDIVMPQVREMIGPNREGPILKTDIQDLVKHVNAITPIEEFQSGNKISKDDLKFTRESSPLAMFREVIRSTPESAMQFEAGMTPRVSRPELNQWNINAPGYTDGITQMQTGADDFSYPLTQLTSLYNNLNETRYPEFSKHRLPGGTNYQETVLGSPLSENMDIDSGHFGQVPGVGKNQISWALHHQREDGPMTPEMMAIPDEIEEAIEVETRKGLAGQARNAGEIGDIRHLAGTPGTTTRRAGTQAITMPNMPAPPTAPAARTARPEPDEGDPFGEIDALTGEIEQWSQDNGREWRSADDMLDRARQDNWPQEQQDYLSAFIDRWDRARRVADGAEPAVLGWERNPDYNPNGPHHAIDNRRIRDPDPQQRLDTAYTNHSEIVANGYAPDHTYFTYQGVGIGNPYADDMGDVLFNPPAYWELRGIPRRDVHRAMNDFLVRYQDPPEGRIVDDAGNDDWTPEDAPGQALADDAEADAAMMAEPDPVLPMDEAPGPDTRAIPQDLQDRWDVGLREWRQEGGANGTNLAFGNFTNLNQFLDHLDELDPDQYRELMDTELPADLSDMIDEFRELRAGRVEPDAPAANPDELRQAAVVRFNEAETNLEEWWQSELENDRAAGTEGMTPDTFEMFLADLPDNVLQDEDLGPLVEEYRAAEEAMLNIRAPGDEPAAAVITPEMRLEGSREALRDMYNIYRGVDPTLPQSFDQLMGNLRGQDWENINPEMARGIREYLEVEGMANNPAAPTPQAATPPDVENMYGPQPPRQLDIAAREVEQLLVNNPDLTAAQQYEVIELLNDPDTIISDAAINATDWSDELKAAARRYSAERRARTPEAPRPRQIDLARQSLTQAIDNEYGDLDGIDQVREHLLQRLDRDPPPTDAEISAMNLTPGIRDQARRYAAERRIAAGEWEVFDPADGRSIGTFRTEREAARYANTNGRWDYARAGEGWSTEQQTKKVPNPNKPKGTKVTHIDELQSYRHQQGRGRGYRSEEEAYQKKKTELAKQYRDATLSWQDYQPLATNIPEDVWARDYAGWGGRSAADPGSDESVQRGRNKFMSEISGALSSDDPMSGLNRIQQKVGVDFAPEAIKHLIDKNKNLARLNKEYDAHVKIGHDKRFDTPDGPYKKSWPLLTLRRMLWQAAQDGSGYLTWNTSEAVQKHGTRKPIADSIYDKELPTVAKGELKRLGLSKDDLTQIKLGPKNNLGLSKEEIQHLEDIGDEDIMTEAIDVAEYISSGNSKLRNSIMNLLSYDQKQEVDLLIIRHRKAVKRLDEGDEDDGDFEAVTDASVDLVNYLRKTGIHEKILDRKPNAWAIRLTPEIREKLLKEGFPKFAAVGLPASEVEEFFADEENNDQRIK
jgi:hypothetical protein